MTTCACDNSADPAHTEGCECPCHLPPPVATPERPAGTFDGLPLAPVAPIAPVAPAPALDAPAIVLQAMHDAHGWRRRNRRAGSPSAQVVGNHFSMSRDTKRFAVPAGAELAALDVYTRGFRYSLGEGLILGGEAFKLRDGEMPRTTYKIRIGSRWLASLICKPGGAVLTDDEDAAGAFDGPVRLCREDYHGPGMTVGLARNLLKHEAKVWCQPTNGGPGFWAY